ncbi:MAG: cupin domain-containing protein [Chloroflexi bacterium]|nr:cupin domain-containing protein [Chloroflexota bacterium]
MERERLREREKEPEEFPERFSYDAMVKMADRVRERARQGAVLIKGRNRPWRQNRQALVKSYVMQDWNEKRQFPLQIFAHEIASQSGRHTHQGGLAIFVVDGRGYTTVDGVRYDWEKGDLILLPIKPGGVEHQHFNLNPDGPSHWLAIIPSWTFDVMGFTLEQKEIHPNFRRKVGED